MKAVLLCAAMAFSAVTSTTYEHAIGEVAYWYAHGAYCSKNTINTWTNGMGAGQTENQRFQVDRVVNDDVGYEDMQAFTGWDPVNSRIIISFRGSANAGNWLDNINFSPENYVNRGGTSATVHPGFFSGWEDLEQGGMTEAIRDIVNAHPGANILVTGHSLGGALATICAVELGQNEAYNTLPIGAIDVITFGSPRVGNTAFKALFNGIVRDSWRIVNRYDIAVTLPTKSMGYSHVGTQEWYRWQRWWWNETPTGFKECDGTGEDKNCYGTDFWADRLPMPHHHTGYFGRGWVDSNGVCTNGPGRRRLSDSRLMDE